MNPFSTRYVQPDRVPLVGYDPTSLNQWAEQIATGDAVFQITGPHGSGKTTLTHGIIAALRCADRRKTGPEFGEIRWLTIDRSWQLRQWLSAARTSPAGDLTARSGLLVVDGLEQLPWVGRRGLVQACRGRGIRLLVTTHRVLRWLPVLVQVEPTSVRLQQIVASLPLEPGMQAMFPPAELERVFRQHRGDLRECLMSCYDRVERLRRDNSQSGGIE